MALKALKEALTAVAANLTYDWTQKTWKVSNRDSGEVLVQGNRFKVASYMHSMGARIMQPTRQMSGFSTSYPNFNALPDLWHMGVEALLNLFLVRGMENETIEIMLYPRTYIKEGEELKSAVLFAQLKDNLQDQKVVNKLTVYVPVSAEENIEFAIHADKIHELEVGREDLSVLNDLVVMLNDKQLPVNSLDILNSYDESGVYTFEFEAPNKIVRKEDIKTVKKFEILFKDADQINKFIEDFKVAEIYADSIVYHDSLIAKEDGSFVLCIKSTDKLKPYLGNKGLKFVVEEEALSNLPDNFEDLSIDDLVNFSVKNLAARKFLIKSHSVYGAFPLCGWESMSEKTAKSEFMRMNPKYKEENIEVVVAGDISTAPSGVIYEAVEDLNLHFEKRIDGNLVVATPKMVGGSLVVVDNDGNFLEINPELSVDSLIAEMQNNGWVMIRDVRESSPEVIALVEAVDDDFIANVRDNFLASNGSVGEVDFAISALKPLGFSNEKAEAEVGKWIAGTKKWQNLDKSRDEKRQKTLDTVAKARDVRAAQLAAKTQVKESSYEIGDAYYDGNLDLYGDITDSVKCDEEGFFIRVRFEDGKERVVRLEESIDLNYSKSSVDELGDDLEFWRKREESSDREYREQAAKRIPLILKELKKRSGVTESSPFKPGDTIETSDGEVEVSGVADKDGKTTLITKDSSGEKSTLEIKE